MHSGRARALVAKFAVGSLCAQLPKPDSLPMVSDARCLVDSVWLKLTDRSFIWSRIVAQHGVAF